MSVKERIYQLIDNLTEEQLNGLLTMLTGYATIVEESQDDAYCAELYEEAKNEDGTGTKSIEDFAAELGSISYEIQHQNKERL